MLIHKNSNFPKNYTFESSYFLFTFFGQLGGWFFLSGKLIGNPVTCPAKDGNSGTVPATVNLFIASVG